MSIQVLSIQTVFTWFIIFANIVDIEAALIGDLMPKESSGVIKRDYEYKRLGTVSLLAGIDLQT